MTQTQIQAARDAASEAIETRIATWAVGPETFEQAVALDVLDFHTQWVTDVFGSEVHLAYSTDTYRDLGTLAGLGAMA